MLAGCMDLHPHIRPTAPAILERIRDTMTQLKVCLLLCVSQWGHVGRHHQVLLMSTPKHYRFQCREQ